MTTQQSQTDVNAPSLSQPVRRAISKMVLDLRATLEDDFCKQLTAVGVREDGIHALPTGRVLSASDQRVRDVATAVIEREVKGGASKSEALDTFIRDSAFTFLNRVIGLRCLEENGLLIVDGQAETAIKIDPSRNASSLYWRVRNELSSSTSPREVWRETLLRAFSAISQQVKVLFDPESEYATLLPLQATLHLVIGALNSSEIPSQTYAVDEFLGWVYQYYNAREKAGVYARLSRRGKIERPEELVAATCLYTERYMVDYLLQNTLGALWLEMHPESKMPERWHYFVRPLEGNRRSERQPRPLRDVTLLDPACGSGHFLVRAFDLLVDMYREEGREPEKEIPHLILERNLHGIDIDLRAVQIAALGLYIKGCRLWGAGFRPRQLNLIPADVILPGDEPPAEYLARFQGDRELEDLVKGIWHGLKYAREFGSLLHPERAVDVVVERRRKEDHCRYPMLERGDVEWALWKSELLAGLQAEFERQSQAENLGQKLFGKEAAKGVSLVEALSCKYDVVVTNPPYAGGKNLGSRLKPFIDHEYKEGRDDLYATFIIRCRDFCGRNGYIGMVTRQSWLFLRRFREVRQRVLRSTTLANLAHLGPGAFEEISGGVVDVVLFSLQEAPPTETHRIVAIRLVGAQSPLDKQILLRNALADHPSGVLYTPQQADFRTIPESPLVYWLTPGLFRLLQMETKYRDRAFVREGLHTTDNERFLRYFWEVHIKQGVWFPYLKGGGYRKWYGLNWFVVDWENDGANIRATDKPIIPSYDLYFRPGYTYTDVANGAFGCRYYDAGFIFDASGPVIIARQKEDFDSLPATSNSRVITYLLRALQPTFRFRSGYVNLMPYPPATDSQRQVVSETALLNIALKKNLVSQESIEWSFLGVCIVRAKGASLVGSYQLATDKTERWAALLHTGEGLIEMATFEIYGLCAEDTQAVIKETGVPAGWHPVVSDYDRVPQSMDFPTSERIRGLVQQLAQRRLRNGELGPLKARLAALYLAGPGNEPAAYQPQEAADDDDNPVSAGLYVPVPSETFVEELSRKLEIHPISVYWLLKNMREEEALISPRGLKRQLEDYVSITVLRLLGYRWPEQDAYERENGPILDPALVIDDGIIPLVACGDQPTALERVRIRLERDFGPEGAEQSEREFRQWIGRDVSEWLRKEFFKRHVQQFKQRPIAWHLVSPERTFEVFVFCHKLSRSTLQKLRTQYAGSFVAQLKVELERARQRKEDVRVRELQIQSEDVEEFRSRIEAIERGDELKYRIRCRWKSEEQTGRPGPYAPDIDDGVKVNIRPFQEAGLLAVKEVIKKW